MGNHSIGRAFVVAAEMAANRRRKGETALEILDEVADRTDIRGADAEFDDAPFDDGPFRNLLLEAFGEGYDPADYEDCDEDEEGFYERVYEPFSKRYHLC